jgi:para-nitrobenzyl esterase
MPTSLSLSRGLAVSLLVAAGCGGNTATTTTTTTTTGTGGAGTGGAGTGGAGTGGGAEAVVVTTDKGPVKGAVVGKTRVFFGIPYAAPPVGPLRWKPPQPAAAWTDARDGTVQGLYCPQLNALSPTPMTGTSEDCLTVNVWTPAAKPATPVPVMVWIHGGGFTIGSGAESTYDGQALSEATGAVIITINYRLGPLGWLSHSALQAEDAAHPSSGMYGFEDQRAALAWTKANAAAFGGDPANVTLFGESAGGIATCLHVLAPKSAGLFQRAIIESGPCALGGTTEKAAEVQGDTFATALGCTDPATALTCMRAKTADDLLVALPPKPAEIGPGGGTWLPVVDGFNIPDQPGNLLAAGMFSKVPIILGSNKNEGTIFFKIGLTVTSDADYLALVDGMFAGKGAEIVAQYPSASFPSPQDAATEAIGDGLFVCPTRRAARGFAKGGAPTYRYEFNHPVDTVIFQGLGAFHSSEVPFIFQNAYLGFTLGAPEKALSKTMIGYWFGLAKGGDPNGGTALAWPKYDATAEQDMVLDLTQSTSAGLKKALCDFWDGIGP